MQENGDFSLIYGKFSIKIFAGINYYAYLCNVKRKKIINHLTPSPGRAKKTMKTNVTTFKEADARFVGRYFEQTKGYHKGERFECTGIYENRGRLYLCAMWESGAYSFEDLSSDSFEPVCVSVTEAAQVENVAPADTCEEAAVSTQAKKTLKGFKEYCGEPLAALVCPVKNQLGVDVNGLWDELENVSRSPYGAAAGFSGFIYYSQTVSFWRANRSKIMRYMEDLAFGLGENVLQMVCNFNGLKDYEAGEICRALFGNYNSDYDQIYNVFAWFALEEVAYRYAEYNYELSE